MVSTFKSNLRWHNVVGYIFVVFLIINTLAGIHLRPPLLIPIASKKVGIIPGTHLDNPNPWFDKLRRVEWYENLNRYIFSTSEGFFVAEESLTGKLKQIVPQPPVSVMGLNVFKRLDGQKYLAGSFNGMYVWNLNTGGVYDFFTGNPYVPPQGMSSPIGAKYTQRYALISINQEDFDKYLHMHIHLQNNILCPNEENGLNSK